MTTKDLDFGLFDVARIQTLWQVLPSSKVCQAGTCQSWVFQIVWRICSSNVVLMYVWCQGLATWLGLVEFECSWSVRRKRWIQRWIWWMSYDQWLLNFQAMQTSHTWPVVTDYPSWMVLRWAGVVLTRPRLKLIHRPKGDENGVRYIAYTPKSSTLPPFNAHQNCHKLVY